MFPIVSTSLLPVKYFKLEGRTLPATEVACNYVRYMIKPEYQLYVLNILLNHGQ